MASSKHRWQSYHYVWAFYVLYGSGFEHGARIRMQKAALDGEPLTATEWDSLHNRWKSLEELTEEQQERVKEKAKEKR